MGLTALLYAIFVPLGALKFQELTCNYYAKKMSLTVSDNIVLVLLGIFQITPCILIPYAFYFVPAVERADAKFFFKILTS